MERKASAIERWFKANHIITHRNKDGAVESVDLRSEKTTDEVLGLLHELPALRTVSLQNTRISDKGLAHLAPLGQLKELDLRSCKRVSDSGMEHVSKLKQLQDLALYDTAIGNKGLRLLTRLQNLEHLNLHSTLVNDRGLADLQKFPKLKSLEMGGPTLTDAGLRHVGLLARLERLLLAESSFTDSGLAELGQLTRLKYLSIAWTRITGMGFKPLAQLTKLEWLHARATPFSDEGLKYLAPLQSLKTLSLSETKVSDKGLKHLRGLKKLKELYLEDTRVTKKGKGDLRKLLPRCVIAISADQAEVNRDEYDEEYDEEYFWSHPPRCVAGFTLEPVRSDRATTYQLICSCGCNSGAILGFPLSAYNREYQGPEFVGPLAFQCLECHKITKIIDTQEHGYDGELGASATIRGTGKRRAFLCTKCRSDELNVRVHFQYDGGELDLLEDEPSITVEDFFGSFAASGVCAKCQTLLSIAQFECA